MTQKERATQAIAAIKALLAATAPALRLARNQLATTLDQAQNDPPDGEADGTIDEATYTVMRHLDGNVARILAEIGGV